jgi:creatinine amidohydrolase
MTDPFDLPHEQAMARVRGEIVWVPVNPVEYHGPHLSLHTDHLLSLGLIRALHAQMAGEGEPLVTADLEVGVDPTRGPGSRAATYREVWALVRRSCEALVELGAQRVVLVTFHGAPLHNLVLARAVRWLVRRGVRAVAPFQELVRLLAQPQALEAPEHDVIFASVPPEARAQVRQDLPLDFHAGFFETSLALHWAPASVSPLHRQLPPCPAAPPLRGLQLAGWLVQRLGLRGLGAELAFAARGAGWQHLEPFPGYTGRPAHATSESGAAFARAIVQELAPLVGSVLDGRQSPPKPPFAWVGPLTLWGTIRA